MPSSPWLCPQLTLHTFHLPSRFPHGTNTLGRQWALASRVPGGAGDPPPLRTAWRTAHTLGVTSFVEAGESRLPCQRCQPGRAGARAGGHWPGHPSGSDLRNSSPCWSFKAILNCCNYRVSLGRWHHGVWASLTPPGATLGLGRGCLEEGGESCHWGRSLEGRKWWAEEHLIVPAANASAGGPAGKGLSGWGRPGEQDAGAASGRGWRHGDRCWT